MKRAINQKLNCIVEVSSLNQLFTLINKQSDIDFQIFHFVDEEKKLNLKIENLNEIFNTYVKNAYTYYITTSLWHPSVFKELYDDVTNVYNAFVIDILKNSRFGSIMTKSEIIVELKKIILKEMNSILWYKENRSSANRIKNYIKKIYGNNYPIKPHTEANTPFHSEL
jgi:hypothetical protein